MFDLTKFREDLQQALCPYLTTPIDKGTLDQGFSNFWCYEALKKVDYYLQSPKINF